MRIDHVIALAGRFGPDQGRVHGLFGVFVLAMAVWQAVTGTLPGYQTMGVVGFAALSVNLLCALLLIRFRGGDSNMRSV